MQHITNEITSIRTEINTIREDIKKDYYKINLNLDEIHKKLSELNVLPNKNNLVDQPAKEDYLLETFSFPLKSCEEIQALDNEIRNNLEFKSQLVIKYLLFNYNGSFFTNFVADYIFIQNWWNK